LIAPELVATPVEVLAYFPAAAVVHEIEPALEYVPEPHAVYKVAPSSVETPLIEANEPAGVRLHAVEPLTELK